MLPRSVTPIFETLFGKEQRFWGFENCNSEIPPETEKYIMYISRTRCGTDYRCYACMYACIRHFHTNLTGVLEG
jgi:hypothetical protein